MVGKAYRASIAVCGKSEHIQSDFLGGHGYMEVHCITAKESGGLNLRNQRIDFLNRRSFRSKS